MSERLPFDELPAISKPRLRKNGQAAKKSAAASGHSCTLLAKRGVSCAPLIAREIADEPTLVLPTDNAERFSEKVWQGESLKLILDSVRRYAEDALFQVQEQSGAQAGSTPSLAAGEIEIGWQQLLEKVEQGIVKRRVGQGIVRWLNEFKMIVAANIATADFDNALMPPKTKKKIARYPIHTGEEWQEILHATSDGKTLQHYVANTQAGTLRHQRPNAGYYTELSLSDEERRAGYDTGLLLQAAGTLDADDGLICLCVSQLLAPSAPLPQGATAAAWIDLNEVAIKALGGYAPNEAEAQKRRAKVYNAMRYFTRTHVGGQRKVEYYDKQSKRKLDTQIYTTPWQIVSRQEEIVSLFPENTSENIPVRVELVASRRWLELTTQPSTAQYLPFGELIGAIPANQPGGAWARVLGLAYLHWCRCHLPEATSGGTPRSRRELLDQYPSKVAPYQEILASKNPRRALDYWRSAESYLRETELIETIEEDVEMPRKHWQEKWLSAPPPWKPGSRLRQTLDELMKNRFQAAPRSLQSKRPAKRRAARKSAPGS